ncbi:MAG: TRAP transporter substrate-binding protein DctP, partial [Deltaproteobacteria bacterium]|nr:TRAP transporter substrate-binding protein DctP [Deltaproteobacteria bacterium]
MRKSMICAVAFLALSFLVGLFGPFAGPAPASAQDYVLEMGSVVPPGSPWALQLKRLKKYVEEETGGRVKVKLRLGSSNERSLARRKALDDPAVLKQVRAILKKQKLVFALWGENGFRSYFSRRPIRSPDDMKGIRYRSQEALAHVAAYKALGASPVTIDVANTMTSLQTGVVDGFDNTPLFAMATTWYQG